MIRVNGRIRAREVRVILAATGEQLGVLRTPDAIKKAQSYGLDLVEVAPNANPPVCRIVDFGKYRYDLAKQEKERRHATTKLKEIKFRVNIDDHDYLTKVRHGEEFLVKGNKVRVQLQFKGRENAHKELGEELMARVKEDLSGVGQVEMDAKHVGRNMIMIVAPLPASKRRRKFAPPTEMPPEEDHEPADHETEDEAGRSGSGSRPAVKTPILPREQDAIPSSGDARGEGAPARR